jgi:hypothetical protein
MIKNPFIPGQDLKVKTGCITQDKSKMFKEARRKWDGTRINRV